jgi:ATP-binding protein involved in chromosome partitioning
MSYFECAHGERYHIFGNGGGEALAERYQVPFLGAVPIAMSIREGGDLGIPVVISQPESAQVKVFSARCRAGRRAGQHRGDEGPEGTSGPQFEEVS